MLQHPQYRTWLKKIFSEIAVPIADQQTGCTIPVMDEVLPLLAKLRRLLRSRGRSVDDTDDLIQEAFLRLQLYCRDHTIERKEAFLVRTALNLSAYQTRREHRESLEHGVLEKLPLIDP